MSFIVIFKPAVLLLAPLLIFTSPRSEVKVIFDLIASNSAWVTVAPGAVISLSITWFPTCGSYFVAWVKILNLIRVGFTPSDWLFNSFPEASVALAKREYSTLSLHGVVPLLYLLTVPVSIISLGAPNSLLFSLGASLYVNPGKPNPLAVFPFFSVNLDSTNLFELSVTVPIVKCVSSVGVT